MTATDKAFEITGTLIGFSVSGFLAAQIYSEWASNQPTSLSAVYVGGFLLMFLFWTVYGIRYKRLAISLTNSVAAVLQTILLFIVLYKNHS